ncbi:MAG: type II toxin-antitoxin system RelE/ParE family toxin [Pseudomonadota bacterium]
MTARYSPAAQQDLVDIWEYSLETWGETQAVRYLRDLTQACDEVAAVVRHTQDAEEIRIQYRKFLIGSHVVFCRPGENNQLEMIRILHQSRDVDRHL